MVNDPPPSRAFRIFKGCWNAAVVVAAIIGIGGLIAINLWFHVFHHVDDRTAAAPSSQPSPSASPSPSWNPVQVPYAPAPTVTPTGPDPVSVVVAYCEAISTHDLRHAWADLGGRNMVPSWEAFAAGYADTSSLDCTVSPDVGDQVHVLMMAVHSDETVGRYSAVYTVDNGVITSGTMTLLSETQPWPAASWTAPG